MIGFIIQLTANLLLLLLGFTFAVFGGNQTTRFAGYVLSIVAFLQALVNFGVIE